MDIVTLGLFVLTFFSILILPGPNAAFAVGQSLHYGVLRSLPVSIGFMAATGLHALIVFSGLGVIFYEYSAALSVLKCLGVIYLLYLAVRAFTSDASEFDPSSKTVSSTQMFSIAMIVSLTNPKALLASLMIYPVFINADHDFVPQALVLSFVAMILSFSIYSFYIVAASKLRNSLTGTRFAKGIIGSLYLAAAGTLAVKQA